jgi:hypothetical protein
MKHVWYDRNTFVANYIPDNVSIIDFGCGNKEILDFCTPTKYLGIDICDQSDLKFDLNNELKLDEIYDIGLALGLLEYIKDPDFTLSNIKKYVKKIIVLNLDVKKKNEWVQTFNEDQISMLMNKHFKNVLHYRHGNYILSTGETHD